jgi:hypothetical protein
MTAGQIVALLLFGLAALLTAISWATPLDLRIPLLLASLGGCFLALDAGGVID